MALPNFLRPSPLSLRPAILDIISISISTRFSCLSPGLVNLLRQDNCSNVSKFATRWHLSQNRWYRSWARTSGFSNWQFNPSIRKKGGQAYHNDKRYLRCSIKLAKKLDTTDVRGFAASSRDEQRFSPFIIQ